MIPNQRQPGEWAASRHLLVTGLPGVGKTTVIRGLAKRLATYRPAGFYTEEIRTARGM